jgi:hypothetical protein
MKLSKYPYKGWDWTEVCNAINITASIDDNPFYQKWWSDYDILEGFENLPPLSDKDRWLLENEGLYFDCYIQALFMHNPIKWNRKRRTMAWLAKNIRDYLKKLAPEEEQISYSAPLWKGLSEIEHDETLLQHYRILFRSAWS